ncbi:MAG: MlaD family protein [Campylobacterota bacterium]|nr:MlaD family protein [Campylobacterota bacterium]
MNNRVNYALVGAVVILMLSAMVFFIYWMMKPDEKEAMRYYHIYFTESVSGLNINSAVKFRGINVGDVKQMKINAENSEEIEILISIYENTPIKVDTVATLMSQGITGLSYIDLSKGDKDSPLLEVEDGESIAEITSDQSLFKRIESSVDTISSRLSKTLNQTEKLLNDKNQEEVSKILERTSSILDKIDRTLDEKTISNIQVTIDNSAKITSRFEGMMSNIDSLVAKGVILEESLKESIASISTSFNSLAVSMRSFQKSNEEGHFSVSDSMKKPMQQFDITMVEMERFMIKMERFIERMQRSPSDLILLQEKEFKAPGE